MISVGSRDARKGLELGFGVGGGGGDMEETELEEGEAFSYHNIDDYDESIDPDIALSYIDEKLQDVLGHFQKDFEGGVSAENLGAKFGGYGSFLPTYQRSPVSSHPRTPAKVQNYNSPRSPNNLQLEGGLRNSSVPTIASHSLRLGPASTSASSLLDLKPPSLNDSVKQEVWVPSTRSNEEVAPKYESANKQSSNLSDQKTLKVRIKVGSDNLSSRIMEGLGLDISPSSSLDESPSGSEGMSREDAPYESPTSILQIMTSFPVHGNLLLSPLPDDLLHLTEKAKFIKDGRSMHAPKGAENFRISVNSSDSLKGEGKVLGEKKVKSMGKCDFSAKLNGKAKDARDGIGVASKKEVDIDALACEELVSNTLKLPIFSNEGSWVEKPKVGDDKKVSSLDDVSACPSKDTHRKEEKSYDSFKADLDVSRVRKGINTEPIDPLKQKANQKLTSYAQDGLKLPAGKELPSLGGERKSKGSQIHGNIVIEDPKESSKLGSSLIPKNKKNTTSKNEWEDSKVPKDLVKVREAYRNFFGDMNLDEEDNHVDSLEMSSEDKLKDLCVNEKGTSAINDALKEKSSSKRIDKLSTSEAHPKTFSNIAPHSTTGLGADGPPLVGNQVIEDNWVCCDKCQKWRILPFGTNPDDLPDKWLCSMQHWLPGMNRCSFTEEETKTALLALYQVPVAENQNYLHPAGGVVSGASLPDVWHPNQGQQNNGLHSVSGSGKKKPGLKETMSATSKDGPTPIKKNLQASVKSRKLNDMNQSPSVNKYGSQMISKSSDVPMEKQKHKHKAADHYSDGGDTKNLKMKSRRDPDHDYSKASKKIKSESTNFADEDWKADHSVANGKVGTSSSNGLAATAVRKDQLKYGDRCSFKERYDTKDGLQVPATKPKEKVDGSLDLGNCDNRNGTPIKRKVKEGQDCQTHLDSSPGHHPQDRRDVIQEESSENDRRKKKKARVSKSDCKESDGSRGQGRKNIHIKDQQPGQDLGSTLSQRSLDGIDYVKREMGSTQPSVAATSSSSKISGSHKTKTSFQDVKGSPVESVSSSPMRILDSDKATLERRNLKQKDDIRGAGFFSVSSPRKCSDGEEDGGSDPSGTARKDKNLNATHRSLDSTLDFQDRNCSHLSSGGKVKTKIEPSTDIANLNFTNGGVNSLGLDTEYPSKTHTSDRHEGEKQKDIHYSANGSRPRKSGKGSSSRSKDKSRRDKYEADASKGKSKISGSVNDLQDVKPRDGKNNLPERSGVKSDEIENKYVGKKDSSGKLSGDCSKRGSLSNFEGNDGPDVKTDAICSQDAMSIPKQNLQNRDAERSSKRSLSEKNDHKDLNSGKGRSVLLPPSGGGQSEILSRCPRPLSGNHKGSEADKLAADASEVDDALKVQKQIRKADNQNGGQQVSLRQPTPSGHRVRDHEAPSPLRRDSSSHAASHVLKEAKDLKHRADRYKNTGSNFESTELYFEASLKFIHACSILESCNNENGKHGEMIQAMQTYSSTAKLLEFCAHEYEKHRKLAFAALAYKCIEVAHLRVIYSSHGSASRDRTELQKVVQMVPPGESPSSSASDVDNLNNLAAVDKVTLPKGVGSPQVVGNHIIAARNRPHFVRLLNFTQDVHSAMEASRKCRTAFAAANASLNDAQYKEGILSVKRALDFNFQDVEGFLRLVRLAMEAINL